MRLDRLLEPFDPRSGSPYGGEVAEKMLPRDRALLGHLAAKHWDGVDHD